MIDVLLPTAVVALSAIGLMIAHKKGVEAWERIADDLHLELERTITSFRIRGRIEGFEVEVRRGRNGLEIEVSGVLPGFSFRREVGMARASRSDVQTGDEAFDERVRLEGDADIALALLDEETRRQIEILVALGVGSLSEGTLRRTVRSLDQVPLPLRSMVELAKRLRSPSSKDLPGLLSKRALEGDSLGVRLQAFRQLRTSHPRHGILSETARALRKTWDVPLRLEAWRVLLREPAPEGSEAAEELLKLAKRDHLESKLRRKAIEWVVRSPFRRGCVPPMADLLRGSTASAAVPPEVWQAALDGLVRAKAVGELLRVQPSDDPAEAAALAQALGRLGASSAQPRLLHLLRHSEDQVRVEAAQALGVVGDARAVEELRRVASGVLGKLTLGPEAETAIAKIQSRLGGSQAGEISLVAVSPLEGAVSRAEESEKIEGGEVSPA